MILPIGSSRTQSSDGLNIHSRHEIYIPSVNLFVVGVVRDTTNEEVVPPFVSMEPQAPNSAALA